MIYSNVPVLSPILKKLHGFLVLSWGFALMMRRALLGCCSPLAWPQTWAIQTLSLNQSHPTEPDQNHPTPEVSRPIPSSSAESQAKSMVIVSLGFLWLFITQLTLTDAPPKLSSPDLTPELQAYTSNSLLNNFIWMSNGLLKLIMPEM